MLGRLLDTSFPAEVRRNVTTATAARLSANACYRYAVPFLATIARGLQVELGELGVAIAVTELAGLSAPLTGRVVERMTRRTSMVLGLGGVAAGALVAGASTSVVMFAVGVVMLGTSKIVFDVGLGAWIADHVSYARRSRVVGLTETSWALGLLVGVSAMGLVTAATSWRWGYVTGAGAVTVMMALTARRFRSSAGAAGDVRSVIAGTPESIVIADPASGAGEARPRGGGGGFGAAGWWALAGMFSLMAASQCLFVTFGAWLQDSFGFTSTGLAAVSFGLGGVELVASLTSAARTDRVGKERSVATGAAIMVPAGVLLALGESNVAVGLAALAVCIGAFEFAVVSGLAMGSQLVPGSPARGLGTVIACGTFGRAALSVPATRWYSSAGLGGPAFLGAGLATLTVVAMTMATRLSGTRVAAPPGQPLPSPRPPS